MKYLVQTEMTLVVLVFILSLSGCGSNSEEDEYWACKEQYSTTSTQIGASGLMLEPSQNMYVTFPEIERFYNEVQACTGLEATGPIVAFTSFMECKEVLGINCEGLGGNMGQYSGGIGLVLINTDEHVFERNCDTDRETLKHEYVHHLLWVHGFTNESKNHDSPFFGECGQLN